MSVRAASRRSSRLRYPAGRLVPCRGMRFRRTRVQDETWPNSPVANGEGRLRGRVPCRQEHHTWPEYDPGGVRGGALSTRRIPKTPHDVAFTAPSGQGNSLASTSVGVENIGRREQAVSGVMPPYLPSSDAYRRIPASCPFPRNLCRQLRATPIPLVASEVRSEASSCFHHPRY